MNLKFFYFLNNFLNFENLLFEYNLINVNKFDTIPVCIKLNKLPFSK